MTAFDFDYVETVSAGGQCGPMGLPPEEVVEETETHRIARDGLGRTMQLDKRTATIALPLDFPVRTMDDWLALKPHYQWRDDRVDQGQIAEARSRRDAGWLVRIGIPGAYDTLRNLMGEEQVAYACIDQPELVHDILDTLRDTAMRVLDRVTAAVRVDQLSVHEDMAGKSGPMFGPAQVRQFMQPYFRPVWDLCASRGVRLFDMDTDGNVNAILDDLLACGLNHMHPMEPAAGMDVVEFRARFGEQLSFNGGLDKFAVVRGPEAIEAELDYKLSPAMIASGGAAFGLDHRIPNGTPLEHYRYYVREARQRLGLPPLSPDRRGWRRMAM